MFDARMHFLAHVLVEGADGTGHFDLVGNLNTKPDVTDEAR
jgi:hypothetical protein